MPIKTLKIKRVFAYTIHRSLKATPPKEYVSTGEIKITISDILPALKTHIDEYLKMSLQAEDLGQQVISKEITEDELKVKIDVINEAWKLYSKEHGNEIVDIALDGEAFTTLKSQFDREGWGKTWVVNIEEFGELEKAFVDAA